MYTIKTNLREFVVQATDRKSAVHAAIGQLFRGEQIVSTRKGW